MAPQTPSSTHERCTTFAATWDDPKALLLEYHHSRDIRIRNRLVALYSSLVRRLASRYASSVGVPNEDLVQVGFLGLIAAIERFQPGMGVGFPTFATPTILGSIKRYFRDHTWVIKTPRRLRELGLSLRTLRARLEQTLGRSPTISEMAQAAGVSEEQLLEAMDLDRIYVPISLDARQQDDNGEDEPSFGDTHGGVDPRLSAVEDRENVRHALETLDPRERTIIQLRFFEEASQAQVASRLGISQMHVSRLERKALQYLKSQIVRSSLPGAAGARSEITSA